MFKSWLFLKLLIFKSNFFQMEYFTLQFFENGNAECDYLKRKESRKKAVNPFYSLGLLHGLCIVIFQQCAKLKLPWVFLRNKTIMLDSHVYKSQ